MNIMINITRIRTIQCATKFFNVKRNLHASNALNSSSLSYNGRQTRLFMNELNGSSSFTRSSKHKLDYHSFSATTTNSSCCRARFLQSGDKSKNRLLKNIQANRSTKVLLSSSRTNQENYVLSLPKNKKSFISLKDYSTEEILMLVQRALQLKHQNLMLSSMPTFSSHSSLLQGKTLAMIFTKKSTRTRVSAETGWAYYGGHALFLGQDDIQLGAGEPLKDTAIVVGSMVECVMARVGEHEDILTFEKYAGVPVINALSAKYHPLQILADLMTLYEEFSPLNRIDFSQPLPLLSGVKVAWIGDANNILNSLMVTLPRLGISLSVSTPKKYPVDTDVKEYAEKALYSGKERNPSTSLIVGHDPIAAVKDVDIIITDTWVSMGQESEKIQRLNDFSGFQVTEALAREGDAKTNWKFMHCLPRKKEEVDDEVGQMEMRRRNRVFD